MRQGGGLMSQGEQTMLALRVRLDLDALLRGRATWALDDLAGALNVAQLLAEQRQKSPLPIVRRAQDEVLALKRRREQGAGVAKASASFDPPAGAPSPVKTGRHGRARA